MPHLQVKWVVCGGFSCHQACRGADTAETTYRVPANNIKSLGGAAQRRRDHVPRSVKSCPGHSPLRLSFRPYGEAWAQNWIFGLPANPIVALVNTWIPAASNLLVNLF
ncbi:hypothetical protein C8R44DRAFT_755466 [Mycena epipterygia]|nr:hypothetical protein C8R44DRAFT_755466 [Mycena epipterygia]